MSRILLVEDDARLCRGIQLTLENSPQIKPLDGRLPEPLHEPLSLVPVYLLTEAKKILASDKTGYDLVILDVNLPDGSGLDLLRWLRGFSAVPVLFLTSNDMETDIVEGFALGCDDYVTKPFSLMVLRARVMALLYRGHPRRSVFKTGDFIFDFDKLEFHKRGSRVYLSASEQKLLRMLTAHPEQIQTKNQLMDALWGVDGDFAQENSLSAHIKRLRQKLEDNPSTPRHIKTAYGLGYLWTGGCE